MAFTLTKCRQCGKIPFFAGLDSDGLCPKCSRSACWAAEAEKQRTEQASTAEAHRASLFAQQTAKTAPDTFNIDFACINDIDYSDVVASFANCDPGYFEIGGKPIFIGTKRIDYLGRSRDNKYEKIKVADVLLWITPRDYKQIFSAMKKVCADYTVHLRNDFESKSQQTDQGTPEGEYCEIPYEFKPSGVTYTYETEAQRVLRQMNPGDSVYLCPTEDGAAVFNRNWQQFGIAPLGDYYDPLADELLRQLRAGKKLDAAIAQKGIVQDTDIIWCTVRVVVPFSCSKDEPFVYIAPSGSRYHCTSTCNCTAETKVPLSLAKAQGKEPCKRCHK